MMYSVGNFEGYNEKVNEIIVKSFGRVSAYAAGTIVEFEEFYEEYKIVSIEYMMNEEYKQIVSHALDIEVRDDIEITLDKAMLFNALLEKGFCFELKGEVYNKPFQPVW